MRAPVGDGVGGGSFFGSLSGFRASDAHEPSMARGSADGVAALDRVALVVLLEALVERAHARAVIVDDDGEAVGRVRWGRDREVESQCSTRGNGHGGLHGGDERAAFVERDVHPGARDTLG